MGHIIPTRRAVQAETELHVLKVVAAQYLQASTLGSYEEQCDAQKALEELVAKPWPGSSPSRR